jgi:Putative beta-barrel porin 2
MYTRSSGKFCSLLGSRFILLGALLAVSIGSPAAQDVLLTPDTLAASQAGDQLAVFAADQFVYDDNLYRLPSGTDIATLIGPHASMEDHINTISAGVDGQWTVSAQAIGVNVRIDENRFSQNTDLNNASGRAKAVWDWRAGSRWLGEVGSDFTRTLASFANNRFFQKDLIDRTETFGNAVLQMGSHWNLVAGVRQANISHSNVDVQYDDYHSTTETVGVEYVSIAENKFGWHYQHVDGRFPPTIFIIDGQQFNRDYTDNSGSFLIKYFLTSKLTVLGSSGYLKRNYPDSPLGSFSGGIWSASLLWEATPKIEVSAAGSRELTANIETESDYYVSTGGNVALTWTATAKISFLVKAARTNEDFINAPFQVITTNLRRDRIANEQVQAIYSPRDAIVLKLSYGLEQRKSNEPLNQYDDKLINANLTYTF